MIDEAVLKKIVADIVSRLPAAQPAGGGAALGEVPVEISARHVHLTKADVETLFGPGHQLTPKRPLSQHGEFLSEERVKLVTAKGEFANVAVLGPERAETQVELSLTDTRALGLKAPVNLSGTLKGAADVCILSDRAMLDAKGSVIIAQNHIHMTPDDAKRFGVTDGELVNARLLTARPVTFENVVIRVRDSFALAMHIDFDEGNACAFQNGIPASLTRACGAPRTAPQAAPAAPVPAVPAPAVCGEKLITEAVAKSLCAGRAPVVLQKGAIVTPSAKDVFRAAKVVYSFSEGG